MKTNNKIYQIFLNYSLFAVFFGLVGTAVVLAAPTITINSMGDGRNATLNIYGATPNSSVNLFYTTSNNASQIKVLGNTDAGGNYSTTLDNNVYGILPNTVVYAAIGGLSGTQSNQVMWPTLTGSSGNGGVTLSQNSLSLSNGQSNTVYINNYNGSSYYVSSNSSPNTATVSISNSAINVTGLTTGSTNINICSSINPSLCGTLYISVNGGTSNGLTFSQNNVTLSYGAQSVPIVISGGSGSYIVSNNSNPSLLYGSISGSNLNLNTFSSNSGSGNLTICTSDGVYCGNIYATVNGNTNYNTQSVTFSQNNPTLYVGQTTSLTVYGPVNSFSISSISNPGVVQANINGNTLTLTGVSQGSSTVNVCTGNGTCSGLNVSVSGYNNSGSFYLSPSTLNLVPGQTSAVNIYGTGTYYISSNQNQSVASATLNGSSLNIYGNSQGYNTINICQTTNSQCIPLTINVSSNTSSSGTVNPATYLWADLRILVGQSLTISSSNTTGTLQISSNPSPGIANAYINGNSLVITGVSNGTNRINVCVSGTSSCGIYNVTVSSGSITNTNTSSGTAIIIRPNRKFYYQLQLGSSGSDVLSLQQFLEALGYLQGTPNGYYGTATRQAVMYYQRANGISQTGILGPLTRNSINIR